MSGGARTGGWQPIASAPDGLAIDAWVAPEVGIPCRVPNAHRDETGRWYDERSNRIWDRVTHWMPIPAPPLAVAQRLTHTYTPHPDYPWFCKVCGYGEREPLQHNQRALAAQTPSGAMTGE